MFNVGISGSRNFSKNPKFVTYCLDMYFNTKKLKNGEIRIFHGGARGVDKISGDYAKENDISCVVLPANWDKYGKSAGYRRNGVLIKRIDFLIVIWDGYSPGTKHMIELAQKEKLPYILFYNPKL